MHILESFHIQTVSKYKITMHLLSIGVPFRKKAYLKVKLVLFSILKGRFGMNYDS